MSLNFKKSKSFVWQHFEKIKNKEDAMCSICQKKFKCVGGSTKGLHNHLNGVHNIIDIKRIINQQETIRGNQIRQSLGTMNSNKS